MRGDPRRSRVDEEVGPSVDARRLLDETGQYISPALLPRPEVALPATLVSENEDSREGQRAAGKPERSPDEADVKYAPPGYKQ